jgi:hypothetical protein
MRTQRERGGGEGARLWLRRARHRLRAYVGPYPMLFVPFVLFRPRRRALLAKRTTEIVIEGFPRSGNTFAYAAFAIAQGRPVAVGRHLHVGAQVKLGVRYGRPVVLLLRQPEDAVISYVIREPQVTLGFALWEYVRFHRSVLPFVREILIARFEDVTDHFGRVIEEINRRFCCNFLAFEGTPEDMQQCLAFVEELERLDSGGQAVREDAVARPSAARAPAKERLRRRLAEPEFETRLAAARAVYSTLAKAAFVSTERCDGGSSDAERPRAS